MRQIIFCRLVSLIDDVFQETVKTQKFDLVTTSIVSLQKRKDLFLMVILLVTIFYQSLLFHLLLFLILPTFFTSFFFVFSFEQLAEP